MILSNNSEPILLTVPEGGIPQVTHHDLAKELAELAKSTGPFAVDTERASGIRYSDRAYLVQIKRFDSKIILLDPVGIEDQLFPLAKLMDEEWILHDAAQDLPSLAELGLFPKRIFDTQMAALLLGFEKVSLKAVIAHLLGYELAKEHSNSDWSMRPIPAQMRAYAALDVALLHDLRNELSQMLHDAKRDTWFLQECEAIRTSKPPAPKQQPWRKIANRIEIKDRRALAMLKNLWQMRDELACARDIAPSKLIRSEILGEIARRKPRSLGEITHSTLLRRGSLREFAPNIWQAIAAAWKIKTEDLPERNYVSQHQPFPHLSTWATKNPPAAARYSALRTNIFQLAADLGIRQDILLKPKVQKSIAWSGWASATDLSEKLSDLGARPWQIEQCAQAILAAAK
ncbi:HRDC domain-containing protein [Arcanobacterium hippocoleae]|uniref:Ribonuclease D n=1 Tax=Arcanobacterium hippocoleae TaxID=149017 RepID=A0ABU1T1V0_9ACTO|nr:HRDC domain-containing protein [Arcanobacterium hippocoleae]MDR6938835.1 ribonuclease D [Arcanobacterium hippocoleae]